MPSRMDDPLKIACDESGHTGPDLLHKDQRYFAFGSVAASDEEAFEIISRARTENPVQMPELKAAKLMKSERGRNLIFSILSAVDGRYAVNVNDKLLALCGWLFEYIYEPVFQDDPTLLYRKNLHRFVAMYTWLWMIDATSEAKRAIAEFQRYMRTRNPADAPFLFATARAPLTPEGSEHPFESVLRFAYGYRDIIIADNARLDRELPDDAKWTLDLSASAIWSHLNHWGASGRPLIVNCDTSEPIQSIISHFTGDERDPAIRRARMNGIEGHFGWKLAEPIHFVDSRDHPAVQIADIIAGTTVALLSADDQIEGSEAAADAIQRHMLRDCIMPDMDIVDPRNRSAMVNAVVLYGLAARAESRSDPYENLAEIYRLAEIGWVRGDFDRTS